MLKFAARKKSDTFAVARVGRCRPSYRATQTNRRDANGRPTFHPQAPVIGQCRSNSVNSHASAIKCPLAARVLNAQQPRNRRTKRARTAVFRPARFPPATDESILRSCRQDEANRLQALSLRFDRTLLPATDSTAQLSLNRQSIAPFNLTLDGAKLARAFRLRRYPRDECCALSV